MQDISDRTTWCNSATATATAAIIICNAGRDREWWARQSQVDHTDWQSLAEAAANALVTAGIIEPVPTTFQLACERADRERGGHDRAN